MVRNTSSVSADALENGAEVILHGTQQRISNIKVNLSAPIGISTQAVTFDISEKKGGNFISEEEELSKELKVQMISRISAAIEHFFIVSLSNGSR